MLGRGLYDPAYEHDACGVALVAHLNAEPSHETIERALTALANLAHRGAAGADGLTGDGAGIIIQMPDAFFRAVLDKELPPLGSYGVAVCFLPHDEARRAELEQLLAAMTVEEGQSVIGWRDVPVDDAHVGKTAGAVTPVIRQIFVAACARAAADRRVGAHALRDPPPRRAPRRAGSRRPDLLLAPCRLQGPALAAAAAAASSPTCATRGSRARSRSSTRGSRRTRSRRWDLAQPFRYIAHNGEINTLRGNVNWMQAREPARRSRMFAATSNGCCRSSCPARATRRSSTTWSSCSRSAAARCRTR